MGKRILEGDDVELAYKRNKSKTRCIWFSLILLALLLFAIGIIIGFYVGKAKSDKHDRREPIQTEAQREEQRQRLRDSVSIENLEENLRYFSKRPHIAGSPTQRELALELTKRWREYGFDKVEMPEYKVLLSFPEEDKRNTVTLKYTNGSTAFQTSGKPKIAEKSENHTDVVPPFLGYAPSGTVEGELVYVNYGRVEDFDQLVNKLNVNVSGKIAIMRYGKNYRGDKVKNAETYGAVGAIIYTDPMDYAPLGSGPKETFPNTPFLPSTGVQGGSIYYALHWGDPLTPGSPSIPGIYRRPIDASELPKIPAHPMSYGDAIHFLSKMQGANVPEDWQGSLNITYKLGPGLADGMKVKLEIHNQNDVRFIYNVIGYIYGKEEPDRYVLMGNHRDSVVFGAVDAVTGTAVTTEIARGLGELLKKGWRPRRTIIIGSWGGEEFSLIGSNEWVEEHSKDLATKAVAYLNVDCAVYGNFVLGAKGSPLLKSVVTANEKAVTAPNARDDKQTIYDVMVERKPSPDGTPYFENVGAGSDYAHFYHFLGVPVADFAYSFGHNNKTMSYPVYHTQHDTFYWVSKFADPGFFAHEAMTKFSGSLLLEMADSPLLPLSVSDYAKKMNSSFVPLKKNEHLKKQNVSLEYLEKSIDKFILDAEAFAKRIETMKDKQDDQSFAELRRINDQLVQVEKSFIHFDGIYGRKLVRHVLFASDIHTYGTSSFPGITDAIFDAKTNGDWVAVEKQISIVIECVMAATEAIQPIGE